MLVLMYEEMLEWSQMYFDRLFRVAGTRVGGAGEPPRDSWRLLSEICSFSDKYVPSATHRKLDRALAHRINELVGDEFIKKNLRTESLL